MSLATAPGAQPPPARCAAAAAPAVPRARRYLRMAGAEWVEMPVHRTITDRNLVTARAWPARPAWLAAFLDLFGTRIEHRAVAAVA